LAKILRVDLGGEGTLLLPLSQFLYAEANIDASVVRVIFSTHEVTLHGVHLRRIVNLLHRHELSSVSIAEASGSTGQESQTVIRKILVKEMEGPEAATPGNQAA